MSDFTALKTAIQNAIKQNGNNEITGNILQSVLLSVVNTMGDGAINDLVTALTNEVTNRTNAVGTEATARQDADTALGGRIDGVTATVDIINSILAAGYVYKGIATPSTNPNIPLGRVFYIATTAGTYTNFGNLTVSSGINILKYNGSAWSVDVVILIDDTPTKGSNNLVKSGGVFANIGAFDISDYNKTGTTLATYANLTAALAALPAEYQKGGMSVKYVQSSDNKYVEYFLTKNEWSTSEVDWEKMNLEEEVSQLDQEINGFYWEESFSGYENKPIQLNAGNYTASIVGTLDDDIKFRDANGTTIKVLRNTSTYPFVFSISESEAAAIVEVRTYNLTKLTIESDDSIKNNISKIKQETDALDLQLNGKTQEFSFVGYENHPITFTEGKYVASIVGSLIAPIIFRDSNGTVVKSLSESGTYPMEFSISESEAASIVEVRCYNLTKLTIQSESGVEYEISKIYERIGEPPYSAESNPAVASFNLIVHNFKKNHHYLVSLSNYAIDGNVYFIALPDASDTSVYKQNVVIIKNGESQLWTPDADYEALRYGVASSAHVTVEEIDETQRIFYCGAGTPFTKLTDAIVEATKYWGSILYVGAGTYDLISELGSTWFDSVPTNAKQVGPKLKNKIHIIFDANSKVTAHYLGSNVGVLSGFSPFNAGEFGFILENLNLECSRCRYAIHDEQDGNPNPSLSHYKNCNFSIDNTNNPSWSGSTCIGGGLGSNSSVRVDGCTFKSVTGQRAGVYYHNSNEPSISSFRSLVEITGCYFVNGSVYIDDSRTDGTLPTIYLVSNNSFAPISGADANGMATDGVSNPLTIIRAWNNQIRNN